MQLTDPYDVGDTSHDGEILRFKNSIIGKILRVFCAVVSASVGSYMLYYFQESYWGVWPWYFSPRESEFDRVELFVCFIFPLFFATILALNSGKARPYIMILLLSVLLLSLI